MPTVVTVLVCCLVGVLSVISVASATSIIGGDANPPHRLRQRLPQQQKQQQLQLQQQLASSATDATAPPSSILCLILKVIARTPDGPKEHYECDWIAEDEGTVVAGLQIQLPPSLIEQHHQPLHRGAWYLRIYGATIETTMIEGYGSLRTHIKVPAHAKMMTIPSEQGDSYIDALEGSTSTTPTSTTGSDNSTTITTTTSRRRRYLQQNRSLAGRSQRRIMVLRISTSDKGPSYTASQLQQFFFDVNSYSVVRQYALCSSGWLWFRGFQAPGMSVLDVYVPGNSGSFTQDALWNAALRQVQSRLRVSVITAVTDHVVFVLPSGVPGPTLYGTGTVGSYRSVFNDKYGGIPNTAMHELGHNLGLNHAGMGSDQYNDETDVMGYGAFQQFGPSKCFNGKHIWDLGWFTDRTVTINPYSHTIIDLACFADYSQTKPGQYVVINVGSFYLVYNAAVGVNSGTGDAVNMVTIVQPGPMYTYRVGAISNTTGPFSVPNYSNSPYTLIIKVCRYMTPPYSNIPLAVLSIGINNANCS